MEKGGNQVPVIFFRPSGRFGYAGSLEDKRAMLSRSIESRVFFCLFVFEGLFWLMVISLWLAKHSTGSWRPTGHTVQSETQEQCSCPFLLFASSLTLVRQLGCIFPSV